MKILHLVGGSLESGAGKGALWLHLAQLELGIESTLLTNSTITDELSKSNVLTTSSNLILNLKKKYFGYLPLRFYPKRNKTIFSTGFYGLNFLKLDCYKNADIIHLHWINGLVNIVHLKKINKPIVWTLRDMWPFTGGCHIALGCNHYINSCGNCPQLASNSKYDLSRFIFKKKKKNISENIIVVGISEWISNCAKESSIFKKNKIITISNNVNTRLFLPLKKQDARDILSLDKSKKIILLGAEVIEEPWKGFNKFAEAIQFLNCTNLHFVFFGNINKNNLDKLNIEYTLLGRVSKIEDISIIYSAADVFVAPSIYDSFGKTLVEAMSCKTLVVCFDATGPKDIVEHKTTGYKALPYSSEDLASGINWVLNLEKDDYLKLSELARTRAINLFDSKTIANNYMHLYKNMLIS
jgi:glycosyltransferase involved in cell wall biosynthesis